jgi:hypothetical protein
MRSRSTLRSTTVLLLTILLAACAAGPHQLRRTVDDWDHKTYVNSPWFNGAMWVVPVIPVAYAFAFVGDFLVTDAVAFWLDDAWDGRGTGFEHLPVQATDGKVGSLLLDHTDWTRVAK